MQPVWKRRLVHAVTVLAIGLGLCPIPSAAAGEIIFLQNGQTVQAEGAQVIDDHVRITLPTGNTVDVPRSEILSVHPYPSSQPPSGIANNPAKTYAGETQKMANEVRRQIQRSSGKPGGTPGQPGPNPQD